MTIAQKATLIAAGAALWIPALISAWKAASMRADLNREWRQRVDLTLTGLSEKAAKVLVEVQGLIRDFVVEGGSVTFDPIRVVREPAELREPMRRFLRVLRVRDKTEARYRRLLWVGPGLLLAALLYVVGVALAVLDISETVDKPAMGRAGVWIAAIGALGLAAGFVFYAYLQHRLSGAEILSQSDD